MASMAMEPMTGNVSAKLFREGLCLENKTFDISFAGKTVIVTGSNTGIGLACAQILARLNVTRLIMAVRSIKKGEDAAAPIREAHPTVRIDVWDLDMSSYDSIQEFSMRCAALPKLDIAILNAGMSTGPVFKKDPNTGHEETIQVNYISTALLSILLLPALRPRNRTEPPGRLTIVGSGTGLTSSFENANAVPLLPSFDVPFSGIAAAAERYSLSKTLVMMLVAKLGEAVSADNVIVNTMQPGLTSGTGLHRDFSGPGKYAMGVLKKVSSRTPEQAAWTYIDAVAVKGKESHGSYIMFWEVAAFHQMMYTEEGKKTMQRLWDETIAELEFAGVKNVLRSMH